jgi:hypothetical protein
MGHAYGSITDTMKVIKTNTKWKHRNTLEKYHIYIYIYIYIISKEGLHMNDTYNPIFKVIKELKTT